MSYRTKKCTVCWCVHASFSPEILHAGAVKGLQSVYSPLNETLYHNNDLLNTCVPMRKDQQTQELTVVSVCDVFHALKTQFTWHASNYKVYKLHQGCIFVYQKEALKRRVTTDKELWLLCVCWIVSVGLCLL